MRAFVLLGLFVVSFFLRLETPYLDLANDKSEKGHSRGVCCYRLVFLFMFSLVFIWRFFVFSFFESSPFHVMHWFYSFSNCPFKSFQTQLTSTIPYHHAAFLTTSLPPFSFSCLPSKTTAPATRLHPQRAMPGLNRPVSRAGGCTSRRFSLPLARLWLPTLRHSTLPRTTAAWPAPFSRSRKSGGEFLCRSHYSRYARLIRHVLRINNAHSWANALLSLGRYDGMLEYAKLWLRANLNNGERLMLGVIAFNGTITALWQVPAMQRFMMRWFLHYPFGGTDDWPC